MNEFGNESFNNEQEYNPMSDFIQDDSRQDADQIINSLGSARPDNSEVATILDNAEEPPSGIYGSDIIAEAVDKAKNLDEHSALKENASTESNVNEEVVPDSVITSPDKVTEQISAEDQLDAVKSMFGEPNKDPEIRQNQPDNIQQPHLSQTDASKVAELEASLSRLQTIVEKSEAHNSQNGQNVSHDNSSMIFAAGAAIGSSVVNLAHGIKNGAVTVSDNYSEAILDKVQSTTNELKAKVKQTMSTDNFQRSTVDARVEKLNELKGALFTNVGELKNSEYMRQYQTFVVQGVDMASDTVKQTLETLALKDDFQNPLKKVTELQEQLLKNIDKVTTLLKEDFDIGVNAMDSINKTLEGVSKTLETVSEHIDIASIQRLTQSITELVGRLFPSTNNNGPKL